MCVAIFLLRQLRSAVPLGMCYCVMSTTKNCKEQVKEILDHFNVLVTEKDIFTRCQVCDAAVQDFA